MFEYNCRIVRVIDGDTVVADVDLGFTVHVEVHFRLLGIDAPELVGADAAAGQAAKVALEGLLGTAPVEVRSEKALALDKYGRWLGRFFVGVIDVNRAMVDGGFAKVYP
jgi:micrococcal nuclease